MEDIMEKVEHETKEQRDGFFSMLLGTLGASLLVNMLSGKGIIRAHPLTNFELKKYYQYEPKLNNAYSRNNFSKVKDEAYILNLDE